MAGLPSSYHDLFEKQTIAHVATMMPSSTPHVTPVWIDYDVDDERILVNTAIGRQKHVNVQQNPSVGVSMTAPGDPYRSLSVIGTVDEITTEGAAKHIDRLAQRYRGNERYLGDRSDRIVLRIRLERILSH